MDTEASNLVDSVVLPLKALISQYVEGIWSEYNRNSVYACVHWISVIHYETALHLFGNSPLLKQKS